jgi:hypothetical protein
VGRRDRRELRWPAPEEKADGARGVGRRRLPGVEEWGEEVVSARGGRSSFKGAALGKTCVAVRRKRWRRAPAQRNSSGSEATRKRRARRGRGMAELGVGRIELRGLVGTS